MNISFLIFSLFFFLFWGEGGQISSLAKSIRVLAGMEDPIGRILKRTEVLIILFTFCSFQGNKEHDWRTEPLSEI